MKRIIALGIILFGAINLFAQPASVIMLRQQWFSQTTNQGIVPLAYQFLTQNTGINLTNGVLTTPLAVDAPLTLVGTTQLWTAETFPPVDINLTKGLDLLNAKYPLGDYTLKIGYNSFLGDKVKTMPLSLQAEFPANAPAITKPTPLRPLTESTTFEWLPSNGDSNDSVSFILFEGNFSPELLTQLQSGAISIEEALGQTFSLLYPASLTDYASIKLPVDQTSISITNILPHMDHLAIVTYNTVQNKQTGPEILLEQVGSLSGNVVFFPRVVNGLYGMPIGYDYRWSEWFGGYTDSAAPWIWQQELGWLCFFAEDSSSIFWYDMVTGWNWTSESIYPFMYNFETETRQGAWLFYMKESTQPRWFYNYTLKVWEQL
ncbi:MAG: hypothetical protein SFY80_03035 [Verrucomicrobiota bacterium]|nr:hypothetical protein [Verrucomicrobiota bacterium]